MPQSLDPSYELGPDATVRALGDAWAVVGEARSVVLVEGVSDQVAVEVAAHVLGLDLPAAGALVMPIGGAQAVGRTVAELADGHGELRLSGMCDANEVDFFRRSLPAERIAVCEPDLEAELIRAAGPELLESVIDDLGELRSFRTLQAQRPWRDAPHAAQAHRFIRSRSGRGQRYAVALLRALAPAQMPTPLRDAVDAAVD